MQTTVDVKKSDYAEKDSLDAFLAGVAKATAAINEELEASGLPQTKPVILVAGKVLNTPLSTLA